MDGGTRFGAARQLAAVFAGLLLWYAAAITADFLLVQAFDLGPNGARYALLGLAELAFGGAAVALGLRLGGWSFASAGLTRRRIFFVRFT